MYNTTPHDEHSLWMAARKQREAAASMKRYEFWREKNPTMAMECHRRAQLLYRIARDYMGME